MDISLYLVISPLIQLLLMAWGSSEGQPKVFVPCTCMGNPEEAAGFGLAQFWLLKPFEECASG